MDKKALNILKKYRTSKPEETSKEDFEYAKQQGLMFDNIEMEHDRTIDDILLEIKKANKRMVVDLFLASLSTGKMEWRINLSIYAVMCVLPKHRFIVRNEHSNCEICSAYKRDEVDLNFANLVRIFSGGIVHGGIYEGYFILKQLDQLKKVEPINSDYKIFKEILDLIREADIKDKKNDIVKKMRMLEGFQSKELQRRRILEALGFCSILETKDKKGFLNGFTNIDRAERSKHSSDWLYPVDWWQPSDGINYEALDYWFGGYPEIKEWIEQNR